jgi:RecA-family ATPase
VRFDTLGIDSVKDANDYLREVGDDKLREALAMAKRVEEEKREQLASEMQWPTPYEPVDPAKIPPRRWVYGTHYIRGYVSVVAAMGGIGKSSMQMVEAASVAINRPLLEEPVREQANVWIINLEDPLEEMHRRFAGVMMHYGITNKEIAGRIYLDAGRDINITFAKQTRDGIEVMEDIAQRMIAKIKECDIGLVLIDPWVGANEINENDNSAMNAAVAVVRRVADETDAAICLTHHIRKTNGEDATVDSIRGAGSLIGAARAARVLNRVSQDEAIKLGVTEEESLGIMRVDDGKANLAPPAAKALYRRMVGVELPNGEYVGVATPFKLPDLFDGVKAKDAMEMQKMVGAAAERDEPYRQNIQAKQWVGHAAATVLQLDLDKPHEKARCKAIVKKWLETDVLRAETWPSKRDGRDVPVVVVGTWITRDEAGL